MIGPDSSKLHRKLIFNDSDIGRGRRQERLATVDEDLEGLHPHREVRPLSPKLHEDAAQAILARKGIKVVMKPLG
jgi:molybdopterin/thiamine biosynthesis adenylyltransferase